MLTLWLSRLNPYSNGSYFLTIMTRKQFSKEQHRLNPYSNGSYFLTIHLSPFRYGFPGVLILILMEVTF